MQILALLPVLRQVITPSSALLSSVLNREYVPTPARWGCSNNHGSLSLDPHYGPGPELSPSCVSSSNVNNNRVMVPGRKKRTSEQLPEEGLASAKQSIHNQKVWIDISKGLSWVEGL